MNDSDLTSQINGVVDRISTDLAEASSFFSSEVQRWIRQISPDGEPAAHFLNIRMFPILQLPGYVVESLGEAPHAGFHQSLISSTVHGYYYIRLIDDVVDQDRNLELERTILPVSGYFCSEFQLGYQQYFKPTDVFWPMFRKLWAASAASSSEDATLRTVTRLEFERVASRKYSAAGIPVAATCHYYDRTDLLTSWLEFVHGFGRWSQMVDDILDWHQDSAVHRATYFLSEGERLKGREESLEDWFVREGCNWGFDLLKEWMAQLQKSATLLGSQGLLEYLGRREAWLTKQHSELRDGLAALAQLAGILNRAVPTSAFDSSGCSEHRNWSPIQQTELIK